MITSPYDGSERTPLRVVLALAVAIDLFIVATILAGEHPSSLSHPFAPRWLLAFGGRPYLSFGVATLAAIAAFRFAQRPGRVVAGLTLLGCGLVLNESLAAVVEGPMRAFFSSGAALAGWLAGSLYAAGIGSAYSQPRVREAAAEIGACAALSATYVGAVVSKAAAQGLSWADAEALQSIVLQQHPIDAAGLLGAYFRLVVQHPSVAFVLAATTLVAQLSMLVYPLTRRARAVAGTLVLGFHVNVAILTPILFVGPMILLAVFSYPWPTWIARLRRRGLVGDRSSDFPTLPEWSSRARNANLALVGAVFMVAILVAPLRSYTTVHHETRYRALHPSPPAQLASVPPTVTAILDGMHRGDVIGGFTVMEIEGPRDGEIRISLQRGSSASLALGLRVLGHGPGEPPLSTSRFGVYYAHPSGVTDEERDSVMQALAARVRRVESGVPIPPGM